MRQDRETIHAHRFAGTEAEGDKVWQVLTRHYFQRWVKPADAVLDLRPGYSKFINNIRPAGSYALNLAVEVAGFRKQHVVYDFCISP